MPAFVSVSRTTSMANADCDIPFSFYMTANFNIPTPFEFLELGES
jgi:hypothetical protein